MIELLQNAYKKLGNEPTGDHTALKNRINVINWLCRFGDVGCTQAMGDKLVAKTAIDPDLQSPVYCGGLRLDTSTNIKWLHLYGLYHSATTETLERSRILSGMGCAFSTLHLKRFVLCGML